MYAFWSILTFPMKSSSQEKVRHKSATSSSVCCDVIRWIWYAITVYYSPSRNSMICRVLDPLMGVHPNSCRKQCSGDPTSDSRRMVQKVHQPLFPALRAQKRLCNWLFHNHTIVRISLSNTSYNALPRIFPTNSNNKRWFSWMWLLGDGYRCPLLLAWMFFFHATVNIITLQNCRLIP